MDIDIDHLERQNKVWWHNLCSTKTIMLVDRKKELPVLDAQVAQRFRDQLLLCDNESMSCERHHDCHKFD